MAGGPEGDTLGGDIGVWVEGVVGGDEAGDVDEIFGEGRLAGLVWWVGCGDATHALVPRGGVGLWRAVGHYMGCGLRVEMRGIRDDTEVAVKDACVLGLVSLKREYSQLFVLFGTIAGPDQGLHRGRASQSLNR
jgi:hypothetical protein